MSNTRLIAPIWAAPHIKAIVEGGDINGVVKHVTEIHPVDAEPSFVEVALSSGGPSAREFFRHLHRLGVPHVHYTESGHLYYWFHDGDMAGGYTCSPEGGLLFTDAEVFEMMSGSEAGARLLRVRDVYRDVKAAPEPVAPELANVMDGRRLLVELAGKLASAPAGVTGDETVDYDLTLTEVAAVLAYVDRLESSLPDAPRKPLLTGPARRAARSLVDFT